MDIKDCLFCNMSLGNIKPDEIVYETDEVMAIVDIHPQAPVHIVLFPKRHFANISEDIDDKTWQALLKAIQDIVRKKNLVNDGFRVVTNAGKNAGQTIDHLHFHILGGTTLSDTMA